MTANCRYCKYVYNNISVFAVFFCHNVRNGKRTKILETYMYMELRLQNRKMIKGRLQNQLTEHGNEKSELIKSSEYKNLLIKMII
jgi:hypothetical protein